MFEIQPKTASATPKKYPDLLGPIPVPPESNQVGLTAFLLTRLVFDLNLVTHEILYL